MDENLIVVFKVSTQKNADSLHSWASLVAQSVKNLPAMRETWV